MASSITRADLDRYFISPKAFQPIRDKARLALKSPDFSAWPKENQEIVKALIEVSEEEGKFLNSLKEKTVKFDASRIKNFIFELLTWEEPQTRARAHSVYQPRAMIPMPKGFAQELKARLSTSQPSIEPLSTDPLKNEKLFEQLREPAKTIDSNHPSFRVCVQIKSAFILMDTQFMAFSIAVERCLGAAAQQEFIWDSELSQLQKINPKATRADVLQEHLKTLLAMQPSSENAAKAASQVANKILNSAK